MKPRALLFWVHLSIGLAVLPVICVMSATGVLLTYQRQILEWYDTHTYRAAPPSPGTAHLQPDEIVAAVRAARPDAAISTITFHADPFAPAEVGVGRRTLFVNPYSGQIWGESTDGPRPFFRAVSAWHSGLGAGRQGIGHTIAAASNLAAVFMLATGLILWWPRCLSWNNLRSVLWFKPGLPGKARDFNWHHVLGFWCALPLLVIVVGALPMSYEWASDLLFRSLGQPPEPRRGSVQAANQNSGETAGRGPFGPGRSAGPGRGQRDSGGGRGGPGEGRGGGGRRGPVPRGGSDVDMVRVNQLWARAEQRSQAWRTISARLPVEAADPLQFTIEEGTSQQPQKRSVLSLDMKTGEVAGLVTFGDRSPAAQVRTYLRFAHTGEVLAFPSQTIAAIVTAAACVMSWTGLALSWRRFFGRPAVRRSREADASA